MHGSARRPGERSPLPSHVPWRLSSSFECRSQAKDGGGLLHPSIEAGQLGATAVERDRQMQGITGPQAECGILQELGRLPNGLTMPASAACTTQPAIAAGQCLGISALDLHIEE